MIEGDSLLVRPPVLIETAQADPPDRPRVTSRKLSALACFLPVYRCGTQNRTDFRNAALLAMPSQGVGLSSST